MIYMIVAKALNGVIGYKGGIPWKLSEDLKHFRQVTLNKNVVMGRKTFESLPNGPLDSRKNIVLTRDETYSFDHPDVEILNSTDLILDSTKDYYIIGGEEIYRQFLPTTDVIYLTTFNSNSVKGDTFFPVIPWEYNSQTLQETQFYSIKKITRKQKDNNDDTGSGNQAGRKKRTTRRRKNSQSS